MRLSGGGLERAVRKRVLSSALIVSAALVTVCASSTVTAQIAEPAAAPSDPRATFINGNVTTCEGAGITPPQGGVIIQVGADENNTASDPNVSGVVVPHTPQGEELNVTITGGPTVVIDAVIVKGGPAYNLYTNPTFLPPTLAPPQHYIAPLVGAGNVPSISHWFVCYHVTDPLPTGSLQVSKTVIRPDGRPVTPLPTAYSVEVNCNDGIPEHQNVVFTFGRGGGREAEPILTGIPIGTVCTVVELGGAAPVVSYTPAGADSPGVTITGSAGVTVNIVNDFSTVPVQFGTLHFEKVLVPGPPGVDPPPSFAVHVGCTDGTTGPVTLPGSGGPGTPDLVVRSFSLCAMLEIVSSLPAGWTLTYSVNGGPPSATPPLIAVVDSSTVSITITNDATAVEPPVSSTSSTTTIAPTLPPSTTTTIAGGGGLLPPTGRGEKTAVVAVALLLAGVGVLIAASRRPLQDR